MLRVDESHYSVDDLVDMGLLTKDGRPTDNMTDLFWQPVFKQIKAKSIPFIDGEKKRMKCKYIKAATDVYGNYLPDETTEYQRYCCFINSALREIRRGRIAYCYYLHQIKVLIRFHPNLKAHFKEYYWEVYLDE